MSDSHTLIRALDVEAKILSEADGTVEYIASNETLDSYNEVVSAKGWRFSRFRTNAPFVDSHNYWSIEKLLGQVQAVRFEAKNLIARVQWAKDVPENKLAQLGWKMTQGGFLKAVSVGFIPVRYVRNGADGWTEALKDLALDAASAAKINYIYLEHELIELSSCIIGANPDALAKSYGAGCIKDADLASIGFRDDDMRFLVVAGKALDSPDTTELERLRIGREIGAITGRTNQFQGQQQKHHTSNPSGKPGGDGIAERQAAERKAFLEKLTAH